MVSVRRKQPVEEVQKEFVNESDLKLALELKLDAKSSIQWRCSKCGNIYTQIYGSHVKLSTGEKTHGCPQCAKLDRIKSSKSTLLRHRGVPSKEVQLEFANPEDLRKALNRELSSTTMVEWVCPRCGLHYKQLLHNHMNCSTGEKRHGCPNCWRELKKTKSNKN